jgi:peptidoglycan/LPS O-acetylase OafA/YrhL
MVAQEGFAEPGGQDKGRSPAASSRADATKPIRLAYLDGLRALASCYVVLFHALPGFSTPYLTGPLRLLKRAFAYGHEAVAIFIVLSGYCLMLPVVRKDPIGLGVAFGRFVGRRAKRILPPYFAALACSLALLALFPVLRTPGTGTIWDDSLPGLDAAAISTHLLVIHNWFPAYGYQINGPLWSVASEWQIYFFFPLLLLPLWRRFGMAGAMLVAAGLGYGLLALFPAPAHVAIPWYLLLFTFGMAAASIGFGPGAAEERLRAHVPWRYVALTLGLACVVLSSAQPKLWFTLKPAVDPLVGLATATLLLELTRQAAAGRRGRLLRLLESRPLVELGHFSYSLYLTHLPVLALGYFALRRLDVTGLAFIAALTLVGTLASLGVAYAFHLLVERPFMRRD